MSGKGSKRKREDDAGNDADGRFDPSFSAAGGPSIGQLTARVGNKQKRSELYGKLKAKQTKLKGKERRKRQEATAQAIELGMDPPPKQVPRTIESTREKDLTMVADDDEEVEADEAQDEFSEHFKDLLPPNVLLTTCQRPTARMYKFVVDMMEVFPQAQYYKRGTYALKKIVKYGISRGFTDVVLFNEDRKDINDMTVVHLPDGPTAHFKLTKLVLATEIKGHGRPSSHKPELILNNFGTRLGHRVGRLFASLFCVDPNFKGRRAITFHNQRDFVFFRHHRYVFEEKEKKVREGKTVKKVKAVKARLQELGPRFTLKLLSLQKGTFDTKYGEYEWVHKPDMDTSRRRFHM